jgi:G3E family GTPase
MIPLCLVTGFLGSGKTTFLLQVLKQQQGRRLVFLVNDFAGLDVDGRRLAGAGADVVAVVGGSIFCRCRVSEFIARLEAIAHPPVAGGPPDGVVVEASGLADPRVAEQMLRETGLDRAYSLNSIVAIVDPGSFLKLLAVLPGVRAQVEAADVALVNKTDLYDEARTALAERELRAIKPRLRILRTVRCGVELDVFGPPESRAIEGGYARGADPGHVTLTVPLARQVNLPALRAAIRELAPRLDRLKGFVRADGRTFYVDCSHAGLDVESAPEQAGASGLTIIAPVDCAEQAQAFAGKLAGGGFDA